MHSSVVVELPLSSVQRIRIPRSWDTPDRLERGVYYMLPERLWAPFLKTFETYLTDPDKRRERELIDAARDHDAAIMNRCFVRYQELWPFAPVVVSKVMADSVNRNPQQAVLLGRMLTSLLEEISGCRRAYLGWLLTNREFLDEHDALIGAHADEYSRSGFPAPVLSHVTMPESLQVPRSPWVDACLKFYARWRLQSMTLPYLPNILPVQIPIAAEPIHGPWREGVVQVSVPDISSTRGRGLMDNAIEQAARGGEIPEHLRSWMRLVDRSNPAANALPKYSRWFRLQHFWRLIHRRYGQVLARKKGALMGVFAEFLEVSEDTIKTDLADIGKALGPGWEGRF